MHSLVQVRYRHSASYSFFFALVMVAPPATIAAIRPRRIPSLVVSWSSIRPPSRCRLCRYRLLPPSEFYSQAMPRQFICDWSTSVVKSGENGWRRNL